MIRAFRKHLRTLSLDKKDPFIQKVTERVGAAQAERFHPPLRQMVVRMPEMLERIGQWSQDTTHPTRIRHLHQFALAYLYNPQDFLPDPNAGLFGYLDDAYLVARVYEMTLEALERIDEGLQDPPATTAQLTLWITLTRQLIPEATQGVEGLLQKLEGALGADEDETLDFADRGAP